jgi:hypothetical protein
MSIKETSLVELPASFRDGIYRVLVRIELDKYLGSFHTLRFGKRKPFIGSCHHGQLDLFYYRDSGDASHNMTSIFCMA